MYMKFSRLIGNHELLYSCGSIGNSHWARMGDILDAKLEIFDSNDVL